MSHSIDVALADLPALPLDRRRDLPETRVVYFVLAGDRVLYIGQSVSLRRRWRAHHLLTELAHYTECRIAWLPVADVALLNEVESACIERLQPALNGRMPRRRIGEELGRVTVLLPRSAIERLSTQAEHESQWVSSLLRRWILERLEEEERKREQEREP